MAVGWGILEALRSHRQGIVIGRGISVDKHLIGVKQELYRKYVRLAAQTKSKPRRKNWLNKAKSYAFQVAKLGGTV
jgi:hypothetical protein